MEAIFLCHFGSCCFLKVRRGWIRTVGTGVGYYWFLSAAFTSRITAKSYQAFISGKPILHQNVTRNTDLRLAGLQLEDNYRTSISPNEPSLSNQRMNSSCECFPPSCLLCHIIMEIVLAVLSSLLLQPWPRVLGSSVGELEPSEMKRKKLPSIGSKVSLRLLTTVTAWKCQHLYRGYLFQTLFWTECAILMAPPLPSYVFDNP